MNTLFLKAELDWDGKAKVTSKLSKEDKHDLEKLLNYTNQSIFNDQMIINNFRQNPTNKREYIFTLQFKNDLKSSLIYSIFELEHEDMEDLVDAYKAFRQEFHINTPEIDLNPSEGEFGLVFDSETLAQFSNSFKNISEKREIHKMEESFKSKYNLNDTEYSYIAAIAA